MKKFGVILILTTLIFMASCSETNDPPSTPMITASSMTVAAGQEVNLQAIATDPNGDPITYLWQATGGSFNSTSGNAVVWGSPNVEGTYTITVDAKDSHGASSSSSINNINISVTSNTGGTGIIPSGNGGTVNPGGNTGGNSPKEVEIVVGNKEDKIWGPFPAGHRDYGLTQYLYYPNEIGMAGQVVRIATMTVAHYEKTYTNTKIYMNMVNRDELESVAMDNYEGPKPAPLTIMPSIQYGGKDNADKWNEFSLTTPFEYDGSSNLLVTFETSGDKNDPGSTSSYAFNTKVDPNRNLELTAADKATAIPHKGALYLKMVFLVP